MKSAVIGFDIGTSSLKAAVADVNTGKILEGRTWHYAECETASLGIMPLQAYIDTLTEALHELRRDYRLTALGLTSQMYSVCRKTENGILVYQWNSLWKRHPEMEPEMASFLIASGCRVDTLFPAYKLYTMDAETRKDFLPYGLKDALIQYLTGKLVTDYSIASPFGLFNVLDRKWNTDLAQKLGFDPDSLPEAVPHDTNIGEVILPEFHHEHIIVAPGLGDGPSASHACRNTSDLCGNLGTSMAVRTVTKKPDFSSKSGLWNFAYDDEYFVSGAISSNACTTFHWLKKFGIEINEKTLLSDPGEIRVFPWLHGERAPYWNSSLRAAFTGMQISDGPEELTGACIRSVAFTYCRMVLTLNHLVDPETPMILAGGGTNITPLMEVVSGCTDHEIHLLASETYLGGIGSAMSAASAAGITLHPDLKISRILPPTGKYKEELAEWIESADRLSRYYD